MSMKRVICAIINEAVTHVAVYFLW